jgi:hypothetical protein
MSPGMGLSPSQVMQHNGPSGEGLLARTHRTWRRPRHPADDHTMSFAPGDADASVMVVRYGAHRIDYLSISGLERLGAGTWMERCHGFPASWRG